jgi:hypothetical protein
MMRGVLRSLFVVCVLAGIAAGNPGDPMPAEQAAPKFETVPAKQIDAAPADAAKQAKHKAKHAKKKSARKHKKAHRKAKKSAQ